MPSAHCRTVTRFRADEQAEFECRTQNDMACIFGERRKPRLVRVAGTFCRKGGVALACCNSTTSHPFANGPSVLIESVVMPSGVLPAAPGQLESITTKPTERKKTDTAMNLRARFHFALFFLALAAACEGTLPHPGGTSASANAPEPGPRVSPASIFVPEFSIAGGKPLRAGTTFFVSIPGQTTPMGLTAHHLFGEAGGLDRQISALALVDAVEGVRVYDINAPTQTPIPAGSMLLLPSAGHSEETGTWSTDIAAFRAPAVFSSRALKLAQHDATEGETVWLIARVSDGASASTRFLRARVITASPTELNYQFEDRTIELRGSSGAPVVNAAGEVVGLNLGSRMDNHALVGIGNPVESIRAHLSKGLSWEQSIHVGAVFPSSGSESAFGKEAVQGIDLALAQVNQTGGIRGRTIDVLYLDDASNPQQAANAALKLIKYPHMDIVAILGEVASSRTKAIGIVANKLGVPLLTPASTNPDVTMVGPFVFRACFEDSAQGTTAARYLIQERKHKSIGILFAADDLYSALLADTFRTEAKRLGAKTFEQSFLRNEKDFKDELGKLREENPDVIYAPIYYNAMALVARDAKALSFTGRDFFGGDGWADESLAKQAGTSLEGAEFTNHWTMDMPSAANRAFVTAYRGEFGQNPSSVAALSFDAAMLLADALKRAPTPTREAVREALANTRDFVGISGKLTMGPDRNPQKEIVLTRIENGKFRSVKAVR